MKEHLIYFLKGFGIGLANIIPGVSGGTIALITRILERIVHSIRSFDLKALRLFFTGRWIEFAKYTDLSFLITVLLGITTSFLSLAQFIEYLLTYYPVFVWSYFFGIILLSVYFVAKSIQKWTWLNGLLFILATLGTLAISFLNPANENDSFLYLFVCGFIGICSILLPGISGSFVLILMGNYELVYIKAINQLNYSVLLPTLLGVSVGFLAFSHLLSWFYLRFKSEITAVMTGMILGSLSILWPWKTPFYRLNEMGHEVLTKSGQPIIESYHRFIPDKMNSQVLIAIGLILLGMLTLWMVEKLTETKPPKPVPVPDLLNA